MSDETMTDEEMARYDASVQTMTDEEMAAHEYHPKQQTSSEDFIPESEPVERIKQLGDALTRNAPFAPILQKAASYLSPSDRSPQDEQQYRDAYSEYLANKYPGQASFTSNLAQGLYLPARLLAGGASAVGQGISGIAQTAEPLLNQVEGEGHAMGLNKETAMNAGLPLAMHGAMTALPYVERGGAQLLGKMKKVNPESMAAYQANPEHYEQIQSYAEKNPVIPSDQPLDQESRIPVGPMRNLEVESRNNLLKAEQDRAAKIATNEKSLAEAKGEQKAQHVYENETTKQQLTINPREAELAQKAVSSLKDRYNKTAVMRNHILEANQESFPTNDIDLRLQDWSKRAYDPGERGAIQNARDNLQEIANNNMEQGTVTATQLNGIRKNLQDNVSTWTLHMNVKDRAFQNVSNEINDMLDTRIPENNPIRAKLRQETVDFIEAQKLFGGDFNLGKLKSSAKDPQKAAALQRILVRANIPDLNDALAKPQQLQDYNLAWKMGERPQVPADSEVAAALKEKEALEASKLPLSSATVGPRIKQAMLASPQSPRSARDVELAKYADQYDKDFPRKFENAKVLGDLSRADYAQGSKWVNWARSVGAVIGGGIGAVIGEPVAGASIGASVAGTMGGSLDQNASGLLKKGLGAQNYSMSQESSMGRIPNNLTLMQIALYNPDKMGKYGPALSGALAKGIDSFATMLNFLFKKDPEFTKKVEQIAPEP